MGGEDYMVKRLLIFWLFIFTLLVGVSYSARVEQFPAGIKTPFVMSVNTLTNTAIQTAWDAMTSAGEVRLQPGQTYVGNLTLSEATYPLTLDGQGAKISGNLIVNLSKDIIIKNLFVDGYGEINGCWRCEFENITYEHGGGAFSGTAKAGHAITFTDSPTDGATGFGIYWTVLRRVNAHGAIIAPGAYNTSSASRTGDGINNLRFEDCNIKSALADGTKDLHDNDNASIRIVTLGLDKSVNTQNNHFIGGDLSDSTYAVKNEVPSYEFYVDQTYVENYKTSHTGSVEFKDCYVYTGRKDAGSDAAMGPGDNDTSYSYDYIFTTANRGSTGGAFYPATDIYSNPNLMFLEYNSTVANWLPKNITSGTYAQCGDASVSGSSLAIYEDTAVASGNKDGLVLKAVGGSAAPCSVRFTAEQASEISGHLAAVVVMRGNFAGSKIGFVSGDGTANCLHGSQSTDVYEIFFGSSGFGTDQTTKVPYVELYIGAGQTAYIAQVQLGRGKTMIAQSSYVPPYREAFSTTGPPTVGIWKSGDVIWNKANSNYWGGSHGFSGLPLGWYVEESGTFGGTDPLIRAFGQMGITNNEHVTSGKPTYRSVQKGELYFTHTSGTATADNTDFWVAFDDNKTDWKRINTGYTLQAGCTTSVNPLVDATDYIFGGMFGLAMGTSDAQVAISIPKSGTVKSVYVHFYIATGTGADATASSVYFRLNDTTDTLISDALVSNAFNVTVSNTALSISVAQGDTFTIKWTTPTWPSNNAGGVKANATVYIE
jgi:hypothetical protein